MAIELPMSAIITIVLFLLVQTGGAIWWMSASTTTLRSLTVEVKKIRSTVESFHKVETHMRVLEERVRRMQKDIHDTVSGIEGP